MCSEHSISISCQKFINTWKNTFYAKLVLSYDYRKREGLIRSQLSLKYSTSPSFILFCL